MKIVLATGNAGKVDEFLAMTGDLDMQLVPQSEWGVTSVEETGLTFVENALLKARHAAKQTGLPVIADDSGLVVKGLDGAPGIYSARYAGPGRNMDACIAKVLHELEGMHGEQRQAYFYASIVYMQHANDETPFIANGICYGEILSAPKGNKGMGYDPIFYCPDYGCSAAELDLAIKNRISHRGQAMRLLRDHLAQTLCLHQS